MLFAVGSAVACSLLAEPLMQLFYHEGYAPYVPVFRVLIFGLVPIGITYIFGTLLTAGGRLRQLNLLATATLAINIAANLLLIPRLGAVGSAWAALTAQTFMAVAQLLLAVRIYRLPAAAFLPLNPRNIYSILSLLIDTNHKE